MRGFWLLLHLAGMIVWIGGMFFAHHSLRPALAAQLEPPQRLRLMSAVLGRFLAQVTVAIVLIWVSGLALLQAGGGAKPWNWLAMAALAAVMTAIFVIIRWAKYPALTAAVEEQKWPQGAAALDTIRKLVLANLAIGLAIVAIATLGSL